MHVQEAIPDFKRRNLECLVSEDNAEVLKAMEGLEVKIINFEHMLTLSFILFFVSFSACVWK